jgi:hypothetical protein
MIYSFLQGPVIFCCFHIIIEMVTQFLHNRVGNSVQFFFQISAQRFFNEFTLASGSRMFLEPTSVQVMPDF